MGTFTKPASEFTKNTLVRSHITRAAEMVAQDVAASFRDSIDRHLEFDRGEVAYMELGGVLAFDSALEAAFWVWWHALQRVDRFCDHDLKLLRHVEVPIPGNVQYVVDFMLVPVAGVMPNYVIDEWPLIGIELDGHAFHETTLEQVTYRNQRDRALQQAGWHIFHFSFTEFHDKPEACLLEVVEFARAIYCQTMRKHAQERAEAAAVIGG